MSSLEQREVKIRRMIDADAETVAKLSGELGYPSDTETVRRRFRAVNPADLLIVAVNDADEPIGLVHAAITRMIELDMRVEIFGLVVSSAARRMGVGGKLMAEAERWAKDSGAEAVMVRSNTARGEAHDFYPGVGYTKIKTQAVYLKKLED